MRLAVIASLSLCACTTVPESSDPLDGLDPAATLVFREEMRRLEGDGEGRIICHHGCPVASPGGKEPWPWTPVSLDALNSGAPIPCSRWTAGTITGRAITHRGAYGGGSIIIGDFSADTSGSEEDHAGWACKWDPLASLEHRVRRNLAVPEVRSLEGPLYEPKTQELPEVEDGFLVPGGYWKVISVLSGSGLRTVSLIVDYGKSPHGDLCGNLVTVDEIEKRTALEIFPLADDDAFESWRGDLASAIGC